MSRGFLCVFLESVSESRCCFRSRPADKDLKPTAFIGTNRKTFWRQPANDRRSGSANHEQWAGTLPQSQRSMWQPSFSSLYENVSSTNNREQVDNSFFFLLAYWCCYVVMNFSILCIKCCVSIAGKQGHCMHGFGEELATIQPAEHSLRGTEAGHHLQSWINWSNANPFLFFPQSKPVTAIKIDNRCNHRRIGELNI